MTPGLNHPEDGSEKRLVTVRMNNTFPVSWANYARDYINCSETYRPGIFTHKNWVVLNSTKATAAFNTQPTSIYKHVINNGQNFTNGNPITTVRVGDPETGREISVVYPVYRFSVSVNGIYSDDPIVIHDTYDTSLFKLFDKRDFGGSRCYVESLDENGQHEYRWINWMMPQFGGKSDISWNGADGNEIGPVRADGYAPILVDDVPFTMTSGHDNTTGKDGQIHLKLSQTEHGFALSTERYYYIHEITPPEGYYASNIYYQFKIDTEGKVDYTNRVYLNGDTLNVRNSPESINVNLNKVIEGNINLTNADKALLSFRLEKYDDELSQWKVVEGYDDVKYNDFTSSEAGSFFRLRNLKVGRYRLTESGNDDIKANHAGSDAYVRYEWENNVKGTTPTAEFEITMDHLDKAEDRSVTFTNTYSTETVDRKAVKKWYDVDGGEINWPKGLTVQLDVVTFDNGTPGTTPVKTVYLDGVADDNGETIAGTASFLGLPKFQAVVEKTEFNGYESDVTYYLLPNSQELVLIKNTKQTTSVSVTKCWLDPPENPSATLCLWGYPVGGSPSEAKALATKVVTPSENCQGVTDTDEGQDWEVTFENVSITDDNDQELVYFITEIDCSAGYEPSYPDDGTSSPPDGVITNAPARTNFTVTKQWKNTSGNLWPADREISLTIRRSKSGTQDDAFAIACVMNENGCTTSGSLPDGVSVSAQDKGNGKYVLRAEGLQKYAPNGVIWSYYATEEPLDGFSAPYQDSTHADVTDSKGYAPDNGFIINAGNVYDITVSKTVTGNFGDRSKEFTFIIELEDAEGQPFSGTLPYEKDAGISGSIIDKLAIEDGRGSFTLSHGQSIRIDKIPGTLRYTVTEDHSPESAGGYDTSLTTSGVERRQHSDPDDAPFTVYGSLTNESNGRLQSHQRIDYVNDRSRLIPTGVETDIAWSFILVVAFGIFTSAYAIYLMRRRPEDQTD